jgi:hypothetical protein
MNHANEQTWLAWLQSSPNRFLTRLRNTSTDSATVIEAHLSHFPLAYEPIMTDAGRPLGLDDGAAMAQDRPTREG